MQLWVKHANEIIATTEAADKSRDIGRRDTAALESGSRSAAIGQLELTEK
jgi:hypothetical protein